MEITTESPLLLIGAGKMGGALLNGWLDQKLDPATIFVKDPNLAPNAKQQILAKNVQLVENDELNLSPSVVLLAVKPQIMKTVLDEIKRYVGQKTLIISIAAGTTISEIESAYENRPIVRVMPNTPAQVKRGISAIICNQHVNQQQKMLMDELMSSVGEVVWLDTEDQIDIVTGLSGTGPAYVFLLTECLTNAGKQLGFSTEIAQKLAVQTVAGAGELMFQTEELPEQLRKNVTSPGGTTEAALKVLNSDSGLQKLLDATIEKAIDRARELGKK